MILLVGGSRGIGLGLKDGLGDEVLAVSRQHCDMANPESIEAFFHGEMFYLPSNEQLHIVNATGVSTNGMLHKQRPDDFDYTFEVNTRASWLLLRYAQPFLKQQGGSVTFLSSIVATLGVAGCTAYGTSKAALHGLVRSAAKEMGHIGARVNAIELGYFDAGMIKQLSKEQLAATIETIPLKRLGRIEEVVQAVRFCIDCGYLNGSILRVNGGLI